MVIFDVKKGEVVFVCNLNRAAKKVFLVGDFNNWQADAKRMTKVKDGSFRARLNLFPDRYEYQFLVDDAWLADPDAPDQTLNPYGTFNSVVTVSEPTCCGGDCDCA